MDKVNDVQLGFKAEEALYRAHVYRDRSQYDPKLTRCYVAQRERYQHLRDSIKDDNILGHLSELEEILLR